ncbi:hypothetical protein BJ875DRAFT_456956 [Amylocarpus encephaloides]|uniref:Uncharacterized protein n=1 Tax=Amylocarpus encephaloides TaxID=45428 RepID=A0A9P8C8N2_9HELO|nr:hypothetical protein BJ875DRAFT_456956 [Amylocarpus encephaloides]
MDGMKLSKPLAASNCWLIKSYFQVCRVFFVLLSPEYLMSSSYGLLLLPPPPYPGNPPAIRAAFKPPLEAALKKVIQYNRPHQDEPILEIAVPWPQNQGLRIELSDYEASFYDVQRTLASLYSLVGATLERVETYVNFRFILLDYQREYNYEFSDRWESSYGYPRTSSAVKLPILAGSRRPWTHVFAVEGEQGERIFQQFLTLSNERPFTATKPRWHTERVRGGLVLQKRASVGIGTRLNEPSSTPFTHVVINGLEELDINSKILLSTAAFLAFYPSENSSPQLSSSTLIIGTKKRFEERDLDEAVETSESLHLEITKFLLGILDFTTNSERNNPKSELQSFSGSQGALQFAPDFLVKFVLDLDMEDMDCGSNTAAFLTRPGLHNAAISMNKRRQDKGIPEVKVFEVFEFTTDELDTDEDTEQARLSSSRSQVR